jgi:hypothetical protein
MFLTKDRMPDTFQLILGLIILMLILYIVFYFLTKGKDSTEIVNTITPLDKNKVIYMSDKTTTDILTSSGTTVMSFVKLSDGDRTANYTTQYTPLLQVANNWYLEVSPSKNDMNMTSTRLRITTNSGGAKVDEFVQLADLVKQKWIFIAILRDGRRFDVIYDNKIVASHRLKNYPISVSGALSIGNKGLKGSIVHVMVNNTRLTPNTIEGTRTKFIDTNNMVLEANDIDISFPLFKLFARCPPGFPCDTSITTPSSAIYKWKSPYA